MNTVLDTFDEPLHVGDRVAHIGQGVATERWIVEINSTRNRYMDGQVKLDNPNKKAQRWCGAYNLIKLPPMRSRA